jgi:bacterial/archaeal transporter family protein
VESPAATSRVATRRSRPPAWLVYSLLTILLWGTWSALTKVIADDISAYMNQVLFAIGILPVIAVVLRSPRLAVGQNRRRGMLYAFITGILGGTGNILFFEALKVGGKASVVVPTTSLSPLVTVILGYIALKEKMNTLQRLGVALALVAIYLLSLE